MPKEKFSIIYADPPWRYEQKNRQGSAELHYPTMSIEEICSLPVADLAAKDSVLFLWATFPQLPEALKVIKAWGFSYRSVAFVWIKRNRRSYSWFYGLGYWTRGNAEICLLAVKGHPKRKSAGVHQLIVSPIERHSKKPDEARRKIVELMGDIPRVELFAREKKPPKNDSQLQPSTLEGSYHIALFYKVFGRSHAKSQYRNVKIHGCRCCQQKNGGRSSGGDPLHCPFHHIGGAGSGQRDIRKLEAAG